MVSKIELSLLEKDALCEVGNVGVGNAVTALSKLLNKNVNITIPETKFVPLGEFAKEVGGPEKIVIGIYLQIIGDLDGECIFLFPRESALAISDIMMGQEPGTSKIFEDMAESAFKEMTNIFAAAYLNALSNMLDFKLFPSPPHVANDMIQSIVDFVLIKISKTADEILCVKTKIELEQHIVSGEFIIMFNNDSLTKLLAKLKIKYGV
jgi:chemotaxis protein CheC